METHGDKQWASKYLLDPLTAPGPSEETGPGTHYRSTFGPRTSTTPEPNPLNAKKHASVAVRESGHPSPPTSASPQNDRSPHEHRERPSTEIPTSSSASTIAGGGRNRGSSLTSRFPGDESHRPLEILKREAKAANRAPHLTKQHIPGSDSIDRLDDVVGGYHHDGPYDATLLARNTSFLISPVEAVSSTNEEALKATPREKVVDSVEKHRPLDGVAIIPPGAIDNTGNAFNYQEGSDLMIEEGNYKRWEGIKYHPADLKGKGEPSYSLEKALKDHKYHPHILSDGGSAIEMTSRPRSSSGGLRSAGTGQSYGEWDGEMRRCNTTGKKTGNRLSRRLGSLRKKRVEE